MKKILILLFLVPPFILVPSFLHSMQIEKKHLSVPGRLGNISVFKTDNGFEIEESDSRRVEVPSHRVNKDLRKMNMRQLAKFTKAGYLAVNKSEDGQYSLDAIQRLRGGGIWGAMVGSCAGFWAVNFVAHGLIFTASAGVALVATPPVGLAFGLACEKTLTPFILIAAKTAAVAGGVAGGVATGPV